MSHTWLASQTGPMLVSTRVRSSLPLFVETRGEIVETRTEVGAREQRVHHHPEKHRHRDSGGQRHGTAPHAEVRTGWAGRIRRAPTSRHRPQHDVSADGHPGVDHQHDRSSSTTVPCSCSPHRRCAVSATPSTAAARPRWRPSRARPPRSPADRRSPKTEGTNGYPAGRDRASATASTAAPPQPAACRSPPSTGRTGA